MSFIGDCFRAREARHDAEVLGFLLDSDVQWWGGYELCRAMPRRLGVVYPALTRLLRAGRIEDRWEDAPPDRPPRRFYRVRAS